MIFPDTLNIVITDEDIKQGRRGVSNECPLALAIQRQFPVEELYVGVGIYEGHSGCVKMYNETYYSFPAKDAQCIRNYDSGEEFYLKEVVLKKI